MELAEADLCHRDLRDRQWAGSQLSGVIGFGVDLSRAQLDEARLTRARLPYATLRETSLRGAHCYEANLEVTDLRGADLSGANLRNASLRFARLEGAILDGAAVQGADFTGAQFGYDEVTQRHTSFTDTTHSQTRWPSAEPPAGAVADEGLWTVFAAATRTEGPSPVQRMARLGGPVLVMGAVALAMVSYGGQRAMTPTIATPVTPGVEHAAGGPMSPLTVAPPPLGPTVAAPAVVHLGGTGPAIVELVYRVAGGTDTVTDIETRIIETELPTQISTEAGRQLVGIAATGTGTLSCRVTTSEDPDTDDRPMLVGEGHVRCVVGD